MSDENLLNAVDDIIDNAIDLINGSPMECNADLGSVEFLKTCAAKSFVEDLELLQKMNGKRIFKERHANILIRDIVEQTIEFIYILKHPELRSEYLGLSQDMDDIEEEGEPVKSLLKLGSNRFSNNRKSVSAMAKDIGEKGTQDDETLTLYTIYLILSDSNHNSYYMDILDTVNFVDTGEKSLALNEMQVMYIIHIVERFMRAYSDK